MAKKDPFVVLDLDREAVCKLAAADANEAVKKAYKKLVAKHHPDRNPGNPDAIAKFKECTTAYIALLDPVKLSTEESYTWDTSWKHGAAPEQNTGSGKSSGAHTGGYGGGFGGFDWEEFFGGGWADPFSGGFGPKKSGRSTGKKQQADQGGDEEADQRQWRRRGGGWSRAEPGPFDVPKDSRFEKINQKFERKPGFNPEIESSYYDWKSTLRDWNALFESERIQYHGDAHSDPVLQRNAALLWNHPVFWPRQGHNEFSYADSVIRVLERAAWGIQPRNSYEECIPPETFTQTALWSNDSLHSAIYVQRMYEASFLFDGNAQQQERAEVALRQLTAFMPDNVSIPICTERRAVGMELLAHFCVAYQSSLREAMDVLEPGVEHPGAAKDKPMEWDKVVDDPDKFSRFAVERADRQEDETIRQIKAFQFNMRDINYADRDLIWALWRAKEILGKEFDEMAEGGALSKAVRPPSLLRFHRHDDRDAPRNLGPDQILYNVDAKGIWTPRPEARADTFRCDTLFVGDFLATMAPGHKAYCDPFQHPDREAPDWIVGRLKSDEKVGFVITYYPGRDDMWARKFNFTLLTPDIGKTKEAFQAMMDNKLIEPKNLHEMLEYGYMFQGLPNKIKEMKMDEPLLAMLEDMLGVSRPKGVIDYHQHAAANANAIKPRTSHPRVLDDGDDTAGEGFFLS